MRPRRNNLPPLLRWLAVMTLGVFMTAQVACFEHCHFGGGHGDASKSSCHGGPSAKASHQHEHHSPAPADPASAVSCATLKLLVAGGDAYTLVAPVLQPVPFLAPSSLEQSASETVPEAVFLRQARTRDWAFTPEVCLGPAFRSLAPPVVS